MRAVALAVLGAVALLSGISSPARAGDYYSSGYGYNGYGHRHVWYSSDCCFKKVTRHETSSRLVRLYDDDGLRQSYYSDRFYDAPRYSDDDYRPRHRAYADYAAYDQICFTRRTPVGDAWGGWVWGKERVCY